MALARDGKQVRYYLRRLYPNEVRLVDEYINEFEHQEGLSCWENMFDRMSQIADDFQLFIDNRI